MFLKSSLFFLFASAVIVLGCGAQTPNTATNTCGKEWIRGYEVKWCHEAEPGSTSQDVILWFHGLDGSQKSFHKDNRRGYLDLKTSPHVISFSFGPRWFLTDVGVFQDSRLKVFIQELMPMIPRILGFEPKKKVLWGESMGGFNVIRLASELPKEFDKVIAFCPAVMEYSPYWLPHHTNQYLAAHPTIDGNLLWKLRLFGILEFFPPSAWTANNPLDRVQAASYALPPIFMSDNDHDQYGFNFGTETFAKFVQQHEIPVQLFKETGQHCVHSAEMNKAASDFSGL